MILQATHTHLYPGHRGEVSGLAQPADLQTDRDCLIEFADGSVASASITRSANGWQLRTSAYRTAAGTDIAEKLWFIRLEKDGAQVKFHILDKAQGS
jgi:fumarylacetoacetate (FAA) hydrolase family protein